MKSCDFETYSQVDLKTCGLHRYASDPSTGIHCLSWGTTQDDVKTWVEGQPFPDELRQHLASGGVITAWNAGFELALWNECAVRKYGWPPLPVEQVRCSMAQAYAMGLPGALENAAPALGLSVRKDMVGKRIMLQLAVPRPNGTLWRPEDDPEKFAKLYEYNRQDVRTELALRERLMPLSDSEQALWVLDYKINQRGVAVDLPAVAKAQKLIGSEQTRLNNEMRKVTGGIVGAYTETSKLVRWANVMGADLSGVAKSDVLEALNDDDLPTSVRKALEIRKEAAKSSLAKLDTMQNWAGKDGRVRGIHQFHGAATGRWAGRGVQFQNVPRPRPGVTPKDIESMFGYLDEPEMLDMLYGPTLDALVDMVRGMIVPAPGHDLIAVDFSAVEARVLAWLAGEEKVLEVFRQGKDIYKAAASGIYHVPADQVTKDQRQIGKVAVLALGYGGGIGAFQSMARNYGIKVPDEQADQIKAAWRQTHPNITEYWWQLEHAAMDAMEGGITFAGPWARRVAFRKDGSFMWCRLPSGRVLCYPYPELRPMETPWGIKDSFTYMTVVSNLKAKTLDDPCNAGNWKRVATYGGSLAENVTQAVARDLLADALKRLEVNGYKVVMHVHDECVLEIESSCDNHALPEVEKLMAETPNWAMDLPLSAEGWRGRRYRK